MKTNGSGTYQEVKNMSSFSYTKKTATNLATIAVGVFFTANLSAAPGELSKTPLFLTSQVQPNILMVVDDSGSMGWENLLTNDAILAHGVDNTPENNTGARSLNFTPADDQERRELCVAYNAMAYDPTKIYTPWVGLDKDSNQFGNGNLTSAYTDPYAKSGSVDLSGHWYYLWTDTNADGKYQNGECKIATADKKLVSSMTAAEKINYANWYVYYRKREYVAKRALSEIVTNSKARFGLATLHDNNFVGTLIKDVDDITLPLDTGARANKKALLKNLFRIASKNGTNLRTTLREAGKYYEMNTSIGSDLFGFSVADSPILSVSDGGECQQNYTILMSDGYWNGSDPGVGNTDIATNSAFDGWPYADTHSDTLADVAMHYYERDLAPTYADKLSGSAIDPNKAQHMVTYTVALGVNGKLTADADPRAPKFGADLNDDGDFADEGEQGWPKPVKDTKTAVDDMVHAAYNGRGEYLSANNTNELIAALGRAFLSIDERQGSSSAVTFNSTKIDTDTYAFQAKFDSSGWHGDLLAYTLKDGAIDTQAWSAADKLDTRDLTLSPRQIVTFNGTKGVPFITPVDYTSTLSTEFSVAQLADLMLNAPFALNTTDATEKLANQTYLDRIVNYFRGVDTYEGVSVGTFRPRFGKRLGDIINSAPVFAGAPRTNYPLAIEPAGASYDDYIKNNVSRDPLVFVGANDGMLHAFSGSSGKEVFSYIPNLVYSAAPSQGLHYLAEQNYGHQPYVDGSPTVGDVYLNGKWNTYLVGAMNAGAKGIYVLDITDPSKLKESFASQIAKLEFTHKDLGFTFSKPQIGRMNNGKWAAIFGNGYNNDPLGDGRAKLFIVYLDGSGYKIIDTKQGSVVSANCQDVSSDCNGLSTPFVVDYTGDAHIDRAYAGDLHGNLWVFDLTGSNDSTWGVTYKSGTTPLPLFQACSTEPCTKASRQPITSMPVLGVHPTRRNAATWPNLMVYFGTGQYMATNDSFTVGIQSAYGIWDAGASNIGQPRSKLVKQTITNGLPYRTLTQLPVNYIAGTSTSEYGWYEDFPSTGERTVIDMLVDRDVLFYATLVPENSQCSPGGTGYLMFVDRMTGGETAFPVVDLNNDGKFDDTIVSGLSLGAIPGGLSKISDRLFTSDSLGNINSFKVQTGNAKPARRTSWSVVH